MFKNFYNNKRVLVTGHTGFKGSWLSLWLTQLGAEVFGYALAPYTPDDHYNAIHLDDAVHSTLADIRNLEILSKTITEIQPEIIFHLAAQPLVRASYLHPIETYETNIMGTAYLLEAARQIPSLQAIIIITTDKCYENVEQQRGYVETDALGGYDPYSSSKAGAELVTAAYRRSFFNQKTGGHPALVASARAGNVIGGGDWCKDRIMTDSIRSLMNNQPIQVRNPRAVRPWQHVLEPVSGYLWLGTQVAKSDLFSGAWNFGPQTDRLFPVSEVADHVIKSWGGGQWVDVSDPHALHEAGLLHLDCTKSRGKLQWEGLLTIPKSIDMTVKWYKHFSANPTSNMRDFSERQLSEYISIATKKNIRWSK